MNFGTAIKPLWHLDPTILFLNHGSFGAAPKPVLEAQDEWRRRLERQPLDFMIKQLPGLLRNAAEIAGDFIGAKGSDVVFVDNATTGMNSVLQSLTHSEDPNMRLHPGDEIVTTAHVYGAIRQALRYTERVSGAVVRECRVPFPLDDPTQAIETVVGALTEKTKLLIIDHISSSTAVIFPIKSIVEECHARGILALIDGAHGPGMLDLDMQKIGAHWYTGNFHKWAFAPKGCAFLWADPAVQRITRPTVTSHFYGQGFTAEFDYTGTIDPTAWLALEEALRFYRNIGAEDIRLHNHTLAVEGRQTLLDALGDPPPVPESMLGSIASVRLPIDCAGTEANAAYAHDTLIESYAIEAPVFAFYDALWLRISAQIYNEIREYERLAEVLVSDDYRREVERKIDRGDTAK